MYDIHEHILQLTHPNASWIQAIAGEVALFERRAKAIEPYLCQHYSQQEGYFHMIESHLYRAMEFPRAIHPPLWGRWAKDPNASIYDDDGDACNVSISRQSSNNIELRFLSFDFVCGVYDALAALGHNVKAIFYTRTGDFCGRYDSTRPCDDRMTFWRPSRLLDEQSIPAEIIDAFRIRDRADEQLYPQLGDEELVLFDRAGDICVGMDFPREHVTVPLLNN